ncbi:M1 family metallopeptidase [Phenylobacterium sp.]|uniref:M1 family metallopeptidase n=1 Tax=Phenylobacterium sp. TaxID=1871053 RepID=UPI002F3FCADB
MPTYLVAIAVGAFDVRSGPAGALPVRLLADAGKAGLGALALAAARGELVELERYFGRAYPYSKLDLLAVPSFGAGAMENAGLITFREERLLLGDHASLAMRVGTDSIIAHEEAHQWFGDLVTMAWWDDLWLNEGFASWMENKATDHFHPEWNLWLQTAEGQQRAMALDARTGAHPVITPIPDVLAAGNAFDTITYQKGQAVIRMLEAYVGEDAFRDGVRRYIARHAYRNTVTADLWAALDEGAARPVAGIADDFTRQAGVPLIRAEAADGALRLAQGRFAAEGDAAPRTWRTPVVIQPPGGPTVRVMVAGGRAEPGLALVPGAVVNAGQVGYFRTAYAPALWAPLMARFATLPAADQLGLLYDGRALGEAGVVPVADVLDIARRIGPDADPVVLAALADQLRALDDYYDGLPGHAAFRAYALARLRPIQVRLGWNARPGEPDNAVVTRAAVLKAMGVFGDPAVLAEAGRRFTAYRADPAGLTGSDRETVLAIVADRADAAAWDQLHALAVAARDPTDKSRLYRLLGAARDPALAERALKLALSREPPATVTPALIRSVSRNHPDRAFDFALAHRAQVEASLEPVSRVSFLTELAAPSRRRAAARRIEAFAATLPASDRGEADKAASAIRFRAEVIEKRLPDIDRWLASNPG